MINGTDHMRNNDAENGIGRRAQKRGKILAAFLALMLGLCAAAPAVQVNAMETAQRAEQGQTVETQSTGTARAVWAMLSSRGTLIYDESEKGAQIYAADFLLLRDKLESISNTVFEPTQYTHFHQWEYRDINEETHTRHCESCGSASDMVSAHRAQRREGCSIFYNGEEYPGIRYTCICGYQWEQEASHTLSFEAVDENVHRSRCCLDDTEYCPGYESVTEEHYAYFYKPCEDGIHHIKVCMDCGYRHEEECSFILSDSDGAANSGDRRCLCGNVEQPDADSGKDSAGNSEENADEKTGGSPADAETRDETGEIPSDAEADDETTETESGEDSSDTEIGDENENVETGETSPDTETGDENAEAESGEALPDAETGGEIIEENVDSAVGRIFACENTNKKIMESLLHVNKGRKRGAV